MNFQRSLPRKRFHIRSRRVYDDNISYYPPVNYPFSKCTSWDVILQLRKRESLSRDVESLFYSLSKFVNFLVCSWHQTTKRVAFFIYSLPCFLYDFLVWPLFFSRCKQLLFFFTKQKQNNTVLCEVVLFYFFKSAACKKCRKSAFFDV